MIRFLTAASALTLLASCAGSADTGPETADATSDVSLELVEVATGLEFPWGMATLPSGDMLVTEREGRLRILRDGALDDTPLTGLPGDIYVDRQGGLLDVALHPDFAANRMVYLSYSQGDSDSNRTVIVRGTLNEAATGLE
ncbi:MAG: PQQ-dependent sugar dehydrogenase, partial [Pseudomonadota bacterium]